jgi:hypothetical protein
MTHGLDAEAIVNLQKRDLNFRDLALVEHRGHVGRTAGGKPSGLQRASICGADFFP